MVFTTVAQHKQAIDPSNAYVKLENNLQQALKAYDFNAALKISDSIANYSIKNNDSLLLAYSYEIKSEVYKFQSKTSESKVNLKKALAIFNHQTRV